MFPIDYDEWVAEWETWKHENSAYLKPTSVRFPGKNFLADEVLGTWEVNGRVVELSVVIFPNFNERDENGRILDFRVRHIGITYGVGVDFDGGGVVNSFEQLEKELGIVSKSRNS